MDINEIIGAARHAKSLMDRDELAWLIQCAQRAPDGTGIEIGCYQGASLIALSLARQGRGEMIGIDDWSYRDVDHLKEKCAHHLEQAGVTAQLIDSKSTAAVALVPQSLAFCFIDGDHTAPVIYEDIDNWTPKIVPGGIVAFHDYGRRKDNCAVGAAVDSWQAQAHWIPLGLVKTTYAFMRPLA